MLPIVPMFHANAWGLPYAALMAGADLVLPDRHLDARSLVDMVEKLRPTVAGAVPTIWNDVMHYLEKDPDHDMSSLRLVVCGGSAVPVSLMRTFEEKHGVQIRQLWGMTETSPTGHHGLAAAGNPRGPALGVPGDPGPTGLRRGSPDRRRRRRGAAQRRQSRRRGGGARPVDRRLLLPGARRVQVRRPGWLRTGDVGRIDERGFITLTDRAKDVIKSGGEWISSVELENCLIAHPDVLEAAVVGVPDERWQERPLAVVVLNEGASVTPGDLRKFLADKVVRWWLPERWAFADEIPRTSVGKYDKKTIRSRYADDGYEVIEVRD